MERKRKMKPIGPLMIEHRLIERMIAQIKSELATIEKTGTVDVLFIDRAVDFIRMYADRCHHGKEEDILFRELEKKDLTPDQQTTMQELIEEHKWGRGTVGKLVDARNRYADGDDSAIDRIKGALADLVNFYPKHIEKEDRGFFIPVMEHFTKEEQDAMLDEGFDFDAKLIHEKYETVVKELESR